MSCEVKATNHFGFNKPLFAFEIFSLGFLINEVSSRPLVVFPVWRQKRNIQQIQKINLLPSGLLACGFC